ncbi:hypothetical protein ACQPW1_40775 [Nocardia sp. CA-128927]|uniref:hypothetical protein n=1 Tax=Nocardia sp. CA-128927 TaxID=3239975 RepID=UPI003D980865
MGTRAAELAGVSRVLDATMPRENVARIVRFLQLLRVRVGPSVIGSLYSAGSEVTHRIDVSRYAAQRKAAVAAHRSIIEGSGSFAAIAKVLLRLPTPVLGRVMHWEWYIEEDAQPVANPLDDLFEPAPR